MKITQKLTGAAWTAVILGFAACASDSGLDVVTDTEEEVGEVQVALSAETETRASTSTISPEEANLFLITAYKGGEWMRGPVTLGSMDKRFPAGGGYTLTAESCTESDAETGNSGWGQKRFTGASAEFSVVKGGTTKVTIPMSVANGAMCVVASNALKEFYTKACTVQLTEAGRGLTWTYGNMGTVVDEATGEAADGQIAYFNIPESGTRTLHYTVTAENEYKSTVSEGDLTLEVAKMKRLTLTYSPSFFTLQITVDDEALFLDSDIIIEPGDVTSDDGATDANSSHGGFNTDTTEPDYDTYE